MRIVFARSARKHRIGKKHALHVIETVVPMTFINEKNEKEIAWLGSDDRGIELEIAGILIEEDVILILHVMPRRFRRRRDE